MTSLIHQARLSNGLKVLLKDIHSAPLISSWLWYRVGSRDEVSGHTGLSHWVEHMQFKGTPQFTPGVLEKAISRGGGTWNAFTFLDWTTYFETLPSDRADLALSLEADRMANSLFDPEELAAERTVIISEREGNENEPLFLLGEAIQQAAFRIHPYHHEVIGDLADLHTMGREELLDHYHTFYQPNNAVLAVAGDFKVRPMLRRIRELFEGIPAAPLPRRLARPEPPSSGEHRLTVEGPGETAFLEIAYHAPAASDPDFFPLSVVDSLLAGPSSLNMFGGGGISNKTSHLYHALVDRELAVSIGASLTATIDPFLYQIILTVHPDHDPEDVLDAFDAEILHLQEEKAPEQEIRRAIKQARALFAYGSENITNQGFWLGHAEMFSTYNWFETYLDRLAEVSPEDVRRVTQELLRPQNRVVGIYHPTGKGAAG
jgi:zinc protease